MKTKVVISALAMTTIVGCGELKKVDGMHDSTIKMSETTSQMNEKMKAMEQRTKELKEVTDELYDTLRQGNALQLRREAYDAILRAPTLFKKISEASKYFMSFEFQIWNKQGQDLEAGKRELLGQQAAMEFFLEVEELAPRDNSVKPTAEPNAKDVTSEENRTAAFNAIAVSMHQMNRKMFRAEQMNKGLKSMSMYTMMEEALLAPRDKVQTGYLREILAHESKAIQLLQTRLNVFPLIFVDFVSGIGDRNLAMKTKMALVGWELDMDSLNATQVEYLHTEVLEQAVKAKNLLIKLGKKPEMDFTVSRLLNAMTVKATKIQGGPLAASQTKLLELVEELK
ncbi:hypothetical protein D3C87_103130 [compost metagenome]